MSDLFNRLQDDIDDQNSQDGLSPVDLLDLPTALARVIKRIIRRGGMKLPQIAAELDQSIEETQRALDALVDKGFVRKFEVKQEFWYKVRFAKKRNRRLSSGLWSALDDVVEGD